MASRARLHWRHAIACIAKDAKPYILTHSRTFTDQAALAVNNGEHAFTRTNV